MLNLAFNLIYGGVMLAVGMSPTVNYKAPTYGVAAASFKDVAPWAPPLSISVWSSLTNRRGVNYPPPPLKRSPKGTCFAA